MDDHFFRFNRSNFLNCRNLFRGPKGEEYYEGDYWIEDEPLIHVACERKSAGPLSVARIKSLNRQFFRRNQQHIRQDGLDISILWFVQAGQLQYSNQYGSRMIAPGEFLLTRSATPFFIECRPDRNHCHEMLNLIVPTLLLRPFIPVGSQPSLCFTAPHAEIACAESLIAQILHEGDSLAEDSIRTLIETILQLIGNAARMDEATRSRRQSLIDRRGEEVAAFIENNLSDPHLSAKMVAEGCGISLRYLSSILNLHGTSLSELIWQGRLRRARHSLAAPEERHISIAEIAYGLGFKSPAHFSRLFKRVFHQNPRDVRALAMGGDPGTPH